MDVLGDLTAAQLSFRDEVASFTEAHCSPARVAECDEMGEPPQEIFQSLAEKGWLGLGTSEEYGGAGGGAVEVCILLEALEYSFIQLGSLVSRGALYLANLLSHYGSTRQKQELLPLVVRGKFRAVIGISEPGTGSDMSALATTATRDSENSPWKINGEKMYLTGFDYSDVIVLPAVTRPGAERAGISVFLVDTKADGIEVSRLRTMGAWQNRSFHGVFKDVAVDSERLVGQLHGGWLVLTSHNERERAALLPVQSGLRRLSSMEHSPMRSSGFNSDSPSAGSK